MSILGSTLGSPLSVANSSHREFMVPLEMWGNKAVFHHILLEQTQPAHSSSAFFQNFSQNPDFSPLHCQTLTLQAANQEDVFDFSSCCRTVQLDRHSYCPAGWNSMVSRATSTWSSCFRFISELCGHFMILLFVLEVPNKLFAECT